MLIVDIIHIILYPPLVASQLPNNCVALRNDIALFSCKHEILCDLIPSQLYSAMLGLQVVPYIQ